MEDSDCSASLSNLICQEDGSTLLLGDDEEEENIDMVTVYNNGGIFSETEEDDYIDMLVSKESICFESRAYDDSSEDWLKCTRSDAVRWILKVCIYPFELFHLVLQSLSSNCICFISADQGLLRLLLEDGIHGRDLSRSLSHASKN